RPNTLPAVMASLAAPPLVDAIEEPLVESLPVGTRDSQVYTPVFAGGPALDDEHHDMFADHHDSAPRPLRPRPKPKRGMFWLFFGLCLHLGAIALAVWLLFIKK